MYAKLAIAITNFFILHQVIPEEEKDNYAFGYEVMISESFYILIMLIISVITGSLIESLLFFIGFFVFRKLAGGYHASTYLKCHIIFALNQIICLILLSLVPIFLYNYIFGGMSILLPIITFISAPIDNENKPFNTNEYQRFKKYSRIFILIFSLVIICTMLFGGFGYNRYVFALCIGVSSANISLLYAYIKRRGKHEKV